MTGGGGSPFKPCPLFPFNMYQPSFHWAFSCFLMQTGIPGSPCIFWTSALESSISLKSPSSFSWGIMFGIQHSAPACSLLLRFCFPYIPSGGRVREWTHAQAYFHTYIGVNIKQIHNTRHTYAHAIYAFILRFIFLSPSKTLNSLWYFQYHSNQTGLILVFFLFFPPYSFFLNSLLWQWWTWFPLHLTYE